MRYRKVAFFFFVGAAVVREFSARLSRAGLRSGERGYFSPCFCQLL